MTTLEKLTALRQQMQARHIDAYLIPSTDPHQSEYLADHWKAREWLSGFTGSAGTLVVTANHAGLWTDSRYFLQAEQELAGSGIELQRQKVPHAPEHIPWLADNLPAGTTIGLDGSLFSSGQLAFFEKHFTPKGIRINWELDLIAPIWTNRPALPPDPVFEHDTYFAGESRPDKLARVRSEMAATGAQFLLVCTLDDIAWALNLRGSDIEYNPLFVSYLLIGLHDAVLFADPHKFSPHLRDQLSSEQVFVRPYRDISDALDELPANSLVLVDPSSTNILLFEKLQRTNLLTGPNPIRQFKAIKNPTEIHHIRQAMRKDGVALLRAFRWLEHCLAEGETVTEYAFAEKLASFRSQQADYKGESFPAIIGYQANGAIIHYRPQPDTAAMIRPEGILLADSGGHYLDGTTDITRTIALGDPTPAQKRHFTLVLKGYITLDRVQFPEGTVGMQLDTLARMHLWQAGLNYGHGTGHGVGFFGNVHEAPQGFATNPTTSRGTTAFLPGMLTSNEPGFYLPGAYGIRTENLILCVEGIQSDQGHFLKFEPLTLFPIDRKLIQADLLYPEERKWLNDYHQKVLIELAPMLSPDEKAWLEAQCRPL